MLVEIKWQDQKNRTVLMEIEGEWSYSGYNHAYSQLIQHTRQVGDKINLICDLTKAEVLVEDAKLLRISPFIRQAVIITDDPNHPTVKQMELILHGQNPAALISYAPDVANAMVKIRRAVSVGI